jgi:zinc/manganese transport system substrate-binding protein
MRKSILPLLLVLVTATSALAAVDVVATLPWLGSLAREIGGGRVEVTTLVKPSQDPHALEAKPSMILAARKADIILYNGLDLEIGYLPLILESAKNPQIMPGRPGNLDCSRFVHVIEQQAADRSLGDVHPLGNPHYQFSPTDVLRVAEGMSQALAVLDPAGAAGYRAGFERFTGKLRAAPWRNASLQGKRYLAYHKYFEYLAQAFGFELIGYIEPKPGIPPSAGHLEKLVERIRSERPDAILVTPSYGRKAAEALGAKTGTRVIVLPPEVGAIPGTDDWFALMERTLTLLQ